MDSSLIYALILLALTPLYFIGLHYFFKNSFVFRIGVILSPLILFSFWANFFAGSRGLAQLFWGVPLVMVLIFGTYYVLAKQLKDPMINMSDRIEDLSNGELDFKINQSLIKRKDEIGKIAHSSDEISHSADLLSEQANQLKELTGYFKL